MERHEAHVDGFLTVVRERPGAGLQRLNHIPVVV